MAEANLIAGGPDPNSCYLQKFRLYETHSYFYMIGRDKSRTYWRVLKIDRREPSELNILEDATSYSEVECCDILRRIDEGNKSTGGLKFVTTCYGIIGFIKFLGPYYMLLITERRKIGTMCGHAIYAVSKSRMIPIPQNSPHSNLANLQNEKRYKKLLCTVDLTKDFFFSYAYNIMHNLQENLCSNETGEAHYETMFVWNEFLTQGIRNSLKNTMWTVALVYGFFSQVKLAVSGKNFILTLIARRSRHYAGTRYLKRGVNDKGRVANDVETEQIVFEDVAEGSPMQISSVVQIRGSIPLFWSQESSRLNLKPDIMLSRKDPNYEVTRLHFQNLVKRYGNPIIILNLIKTVEKKPRETILCTEFAKAVRIINRNSTKENRLRFFHLDLSKHSRKSTNALVHLGRVAAYALNLTGLFYCQVGPKCRQEGLLNLYGFEQNDGDCSQVFDKIGGNLEENVKVAISYSTENGCKKALMFQKGVLRTNCIDCLDRTNVAQYAYGLVALGRQLHVLGYTKSSSIDLDAPLAEDLTRIYETMGDTLAHQYGGSAAHNKIFSQRRGQWKAATQSQEFLRTLQRYYSNAYMDAEKQNAINVFLGHFQPQQGKPALWELDSDQHHNVGVHAPTTLIEDARSRIRRSFSDGNIQCGSHLDTPHSNEARNQTFSVNTDDIKDLSDSVPICNTDLYYSRYTPTPSCRQTFGDMEGDGFFESDHICYDEIGEECSCTNFDKDWLSSSGNSCEDEPNARSTAGMSSDSENIAAELKIEMPSSPSESGSSILGGERAASMYTSTNNIRDEFPESFVRWVANGRMLEPLTFNFLTSS